MKSNRTLNGYILVYRPEHPKAMKNGNWKGYVYEHILMIEEDLGRSLLKDEEVHHLDLDRSNNCIHNLVVLNKCHHRRLHRWIKDGAPILKNIERISVNSTKPKLRCKCCNKPLKLKQKDYCSKSCYLKGKEQSSKMNTVSLEEVLNKLSISSMLKVATDYNISSNGLKKWLFTKHNFNKVTLSEVLSTLKKRAETSGEVKSS